MRLMPRMVLIAALVLAAGCGTGGGDPSPTPSTPAVVNPTPTPTPTPTSSEDALYAEAERVFRASLESQWKYQLEGDCSEFPAELTDYFSPECLALVREVFDEMAAEGIRARGGRPMAEAGPLFGHSKNGSVAAVQACYDARGLTTVNASDEIVRHGVLLRIHAFFKFYDEKLKMLDAEMVEVEECSLS